MTLTPLTSSSHTIIFLHTHFYPSLSRPFPHRSEFFVLLRNFFFFVNFHLYYSYSDSYSSSFFLFNVEFFPLPCTSVSLNSCFSIIQCQFRAFERDTFPALRTYPIDFFILYCSDCHFFIILIVFFLTNDFFPFYTFIFY